MKRPSTIDVLITLMERKPLALDKAAEAEAEGKPARALYWRTVAQEAALLYAWMAGDDARAAVSQQDKRILSHDVELADHQLVEYRESARAALEAAS